MILTLLLAVVLAPPPAPAPAADQPPTPQTVRAALDGGDASDALRQISRLLAVRGPAARGLDRYELFTLKAEAHLRLKANDAAAQAFAQAAEHTDDAEKAAVARASAQLVRRSRNGVYTTRHVIKRRPNPPEPIDIVSVESRKIALQSMLVDELAELAPRFRAAKVARSLPPALTTMKAARELAALELAANGSSDQANGIVEGLKQSSKELLTRALERTTKRVDQITEMANDPERVRQVIPNPFGGFEVAIAERRRGLKRQDIGDLKALADTCDEVAAGGRAVARAAGADESEFEELIDAAEDLRMHIRRMLRAHDVEY